MQKYTKPEYIGCGGFGKVYKVKDKETDRLYALKAVSINPDSMEMFRQESKMLNKAAELSSPYIVKYRESFIDEEGENCMIVMEFCSGGNLGKIISSYHTDKALIPEHRVKKYMFQILSGVKYLHDSKIIHKDLKPKNILVDSKGVLKIADFGLSLQLSSRCDYAYGASGTQAYLSFEAITRKKFNYTVDIWALGCIFYELCCLKLAFDPSDPKFYPKLETGTFDVEAFPKEYDPEILSIIKSMLNPDRRKRPSCSQLLERLGIKELKPNKMYSRKPIKPATKIREAEVPTEKIKYYKNGNKYEGEFKNGMRHGKGVMHYYYGNKYYGEWKLDKKEGKGIYYWKDGRRYSGDFADDKINGKGTFDYKNGDRYIGEVNNGNRHGEGIYYYTNGDKYIGNWKNDKQHGIGVHYFIDGTEVKGSFCNGDINGKGQIHIPNELVYNGDIKHYKADGFGEAVYTNGDKYIGEWKSNQRHGNGTLYTPNGKACKRNWRYGVAVPMTGVNRAHAEGFMRHCRQLSLLRIISCNPSGWRVVFKQKYYQI